MPGERGAREKEGEKREASQPPFNPTPSNTCLSGLATGFQMLDYIVKGHPRSTNSSRYTGKAVSWNIFRRFLIHGDKRAKDLSARSSRSNRRRRTQLTTPDAGQHITVPGALHHGRGLHGSPSPPSRATFFSSLFLNADVMSIMARDSNGRLTRLDLLPVARSSSFSFFFWSGISPVVVPACHKIKSMAPTEKWPRDNGDGLGWRTGCENLEASRSANLT